MLISYIIIIIAIILTVIRICKTSEPSFAKGVLNLILIEIAFGLILAVIWIIIDL